MQGITVMVLKKIIPPYPAMILEGKEKTLIITDLHIGFESNLAANEITIGKKSTINETIKDVTLIIEKTDADSLVLLGDTKSSIRKITSTEWNDVPKFFEEIEKIVPIHLIPGNHDSGIEQLIPSSVNLSSQKGMMIEDVLLMHGHTTPTENFSSANNVIMGHVHPVFFQHDSVVNGQRVWVSIKCKKQEVFSSTKGDLEITIMPSFNKYFYATQKKFYKRSISPIIEKISPYDAKIATLDGTIIGDITSIGKVI